MDRELGRICRGAALLGLCVFAACGDPSTNDARGYTKAPLEHAGVIIKGEGSSAMDSLGSPIVPRDTVIPAEKIQPTTAQPKR